MGKLVDIYTSIKNPLEDEELLKKILKLLTIKFQI